MSVYTKCNPAAKESLESGSYREVWGVMISPTQMRVHIFSVIRENCISDRSICYIGEEYRPVITIKPDAKLIFMDMRRFQIHRRRNLQMAKTKKNKGPTALGSFLENADLPQESVKVGRPHIDSMGHATILFALRYLVANLDESGYETSEHVQDVQSRNGSSPLTEDEIGRVADLINTKTVVL